TVTEAIARVFGVRKATLFFGTAYDEIVEDAEPPLIGIPASLFPQYQEKWAARDIFNLPEARRRLVDSGFATVDDLDRLPAPQE
ncbi:hypothetical protein N3930_46140, partial [Bacillus thuringiensis]|nr:hypothetical protein [Bacillus thuringiensis]